MELILLFFSKLLFFTLTAIFLAIGCMCLLIFIPGLFLDDKTRGDLAIPLVYFSYFVGIYIFVGLWIDDFFGVYIYPGRYINLIFENTLVNILICILSVAYPFIHNLLRFVGESIFKSNEGLLSYIKMVNVLYMFVFLFVVSLFGFTDFSLTSGWDFIKSGELDYNWTSSRGLLWSVLFIIYPTVILVTAITYGKMSFDRIKEPKNILNEEYD